MGKCHETNFKEFFLCGHTLIKEYLIAEVLYKKKQSKYDIDFWICHDKLIYVKDVYFHKNYLQHL